MDDPSAWDLCGARRFASSLGGDLSSTLRRFYDTTDTKLLHEPIASNHSAALSTNRAVSVVSGAREAERYPPHNGHIVAPRLVRNTVFNLAGQGVPLLAAFFAIPYLVRGLGTDRFGVVTLAWVLIGYFSVFDLGFGRALTQVVAAKLSDSAELRAPSLVWPALGLTLLLGIVGALLLSAIAPILVYSVLKIPKSLQAETLNSFYVLATALPFVVVTAGLVGILSAFHRFGVLNAIRAPMGIYTFLAPLTVLPFSHSLVYVMMILAIGRILAFGAHVAACRAVMPPLLYQSFMDFASVRPLFRFGFWMTVTNIVGPMMVYVDRFVIGGIISIAAVSYYATPYEMTIKLLIVPAAVISVLFPAFAASYRRDLGRVVRLFVKATKYIALMLFPAILVVIAFANEGLRWWLGDEFALHSTPVLQWLTIGVFINSIAQVFFTLLQGIGRPDLSAKLHMAELPLYIIVLFWSVNNYGVLGAAVAWSARVAVDAILLLWLATRSLGEVGLFRRTVAGLMLPLCALSLPLLSTRLTYRLVTVGVTLIVFLIVGWTGVLAEDERARIKAWIFG
jgi:O-antigen/teichoic acid export membrane protein